MPANRGRNMQAALAIAALCALSLMSTMYIGQGTILSDQNDQVTLPDKTTENNPLNEFLDAIELGWGSSARPSWLEELCPEVVNHFDRFPSFTDFGMDENGVQVPIQSTLYVTKLVCTFKILKSVVASLNAHIYLHAGSHLGAVIHGQPIPWDDDADAFVDYARMDDILVKCQAGVAVHPDATMFCYKGFNAIKVWIESNVGHKRTIQDPKLPWDSPFIDTFLYRYNSTSEKVVEVNPDGKPMLQAYAFADYFPTQPYYFGGIYVLGPQPGIVKKRYKLDVCRISTWNHRLEKRAGLINTSLDCERLIKRFPFVKDLNWSSNQITNGNNTQNIFPTYAASVAPLTSTSIEQRTEWRERTAAEGQELTQNLPNLDNIEIDNTISPLDECIADTAGLKVVEFNAERGRWWLESSSLLKDADVIILNEMDIGMARSDQQHTTRLLAHFLGMNYAWGLEFVELTQGDKGDRAFNSQSFPDLNGLHGNAFLTKCKISEPVLFRNEIGEYFSDKKNGINANGLEKRLGGRMGLFGRIVVDGSPVVIGSVHKLNGFRKEIKDYIGSSFAIIGGDQVESFCGDVGLKSIVSNERTNTWPATCSIFGTGRGDWICSDLVELGVEKTILPCINGFGFDILLSDHALTSAVFLVN